MASIREWYDKNQDWAAPVGQVAAVSAVAPVLGGIYGAKTLLGKIGDNQSMKATKANQADIDADLMKAKKMVGKQAELRPEMSESIAEARKLYQEGRIRAETGFDIAQEADFNNKLNSQIKGDRIAAMEAGGGQAGNTIASVLSNRKVGALLDYAGKDAALKLNKQEALNPLYNNVQENAMAVQGQQNIYDQALAKTISDLKLNKYMLREDIGQKRANNLNKYQNQLNQTVGQAASFALKGGAGNTLGGGAGGGGGTNPMIGSPENTQYGSFSSYGTQNG